MNIFGYLSIELVVMSYLLYIYGALFWFPGMITLGVNVGIALRKLWRKETNV